MHMDKILANYNYCCLLLVTNESVTEPVEVPDSPILFRRFIFRPPPNVVRLNRLTASPI